MPFAQQRIARLGQPHEVGLLRPQYAKGLIVAVTPAFPGNAIGAKAASAYPAIVPASDRKAFDTATSAITIPSVSIASGSDVTALFVIRNYSGAPGTNPGIWRSGSYFFIVQLSNSRPWIRWGGDVLMPSSGAFQFAAGGNYNVIYRVKSGTSCDFWANGVQQYVGSTPGATPATSISIIGYQNDPSQKVGQLAESYFWTRYWTDDECAEATGNPAAMYDADEINIWFPGAGGSTDFFAGVSEGASAGSSATASASFLQSIAEGATGGATIAGVGGFLGTVAEPAAAGDSHASLSALFSNVSETANGGASQASTYGGVADVSEASSADATPSALAGFVGAVSAVSTADASFSSLASFLSTISEPSTAGESSTGDTTGGFSGDVTEASTAGSSQASAVALLAAISEAGAVGSSESAQQSSPVAISEAASADATVSTAGSGSASISEAGTAGATHTGNIDAQATISADSGASASGAISLFGTMGQVTEGLTASEGASASAYFYGAAIEPSAADTVVSLHSSYVVSVAEASVADDLWYGAVGSSSDIASFPNRIDVVMRSDDVVVFFPPQI